MCYYDARIVLSSTSVFPVRVVTTASFVVVVVFHSVSIAWPLSQAMFNVAKVAKSHILRYFNDVFTGICRLVADMDPEVRTDADAMNRKMKDIVTGADEGVDG